MTFRKRTWCILLRETYHSATDHLYGLGVSVDGVSVVWWGDAGIVKNHNHRLLPSRVANPEEGKREKVKVHVLDLVATLGSQVHKGHP